MGWRSSAGSRSWADHVERMEGVDAGYLYMETPTMHMHTVKVAILERDGAYDIDSFSEEVLARLDRLPPFGRRVLNVPFRLQPSVWVADRPLDISRHIVHEALPRSRDGGRAGSRSSRISSGRIISVPLDRNIPLWELHLVEGLEGGRVAVVAKLHHALADGNAANNLLANVTGAGGPAGQPHALEPTPTRTRLIGDAVKDFVKQLFSLPALLRRTATNVTALVKIRRGLGRHAAPPAPGRARARRSTPPSAAPQLRHLHALARRAQGREVRARRHPQRRRPGRGGGALRRCMDERGERPSGSLTAGVPVGTDAAGEEVRLERNRVSTLFTTLATDIDDPQERLAEDPPGHRRLQLVQKTLGPDMLIDWVQFTPPAPFAAGMRLYSRARAASWHPAPFNVVVSNVAGPRRGTDAGGLAAGGPVQRRADPRGDRAERDGVEPTRTGSTSA